MEKQGVIVNKVLLISINSLYEHTGGGLYLRTLTKGYVDNGFETKVLCKAEFNQGSENSITNKNLSNLFLKKNIISDLVSRFFLCPSFLFYYIIKIFIVARKYEIISFHSSRLGMIIFLTKIVYPRKKIICHFDNVETKLINQAPINFSLRGMLTIIDRLLMPLSEWLAITFSNKNSFITNDDKKYFEKICRNKDSLILPICLTRNSTDNKPAVGVLDRRPSILFTGSFTFFPNVEALHVLLKLAKDNLKYDFFIAGKGLDKLRLEVTENVYLYSNLSPDDMDSMYKQCDFFLSPIYSGSGMKTKLAEALSYGLPVLSDHRSVSGYHAAIKDGVVLTYDESIYSYGRFDEMMNALSKINSESVYKVFDLNYSDRCASDVILRLVK